MFPRLSIRSFFEFFKEMLRYMGNPIVLFSGLLVGFATSIRILGPLAGVIVLVTL